MRLRIAGPLLLAVLLALFLLVTPIMQSIAERRTNAVETERREAMARTTELAQVALEDGDLTPLSRHLQRYHALFDEDVLVLDAAGEVLLSVGDLDPRSSEVQRRVRDFGANLAQLDLPTLSPWSPVTALLSAPVAIERDLAGGVVVMEVDLREARREVRDEWLLLLVPVSAGLLALMAATLWATGWILRPVHRLNRATHALAGGDHVADLTLSGPPELRRLASSFQIMASTLETTVAQQRDLVAGTSHQLRNPLAAVRLHVDLLAEEPTADRHVVEAVQRDLDRLDATVDRLLGLAEAEHRVNERRAALAVQEGGPPVAEATEAVAVERYVRERWADLVGPGLTTTAEPGLVVGVGSHDLLEMVDTALDNAVKYAGDSPVVRVVLATGAEGRATVRVEDDGAGLSEEELHHVGARFWRSSRHAHAPGTGLGLALVDALARTHDGSMTVGRSELGGLAVTLDLPRAEEPR